MKSIQYEELCRFFLADKLEIPIKEVSSVNIPNPARPDLLPYGHQIDLYWENGNELTQYVNIANAKWRGSSKVKQGEILLLQKVKEKVAANKSMMITNTGFTKGAKAVAEDEGVALHIVRPNFDHVILHPKNRDTIQTQLQEFSTNSKPTYIHEIVHRAFELATVAAVQSSASVKKVAYSNRMTQSYSNRTAPSYTQKAPGGQGRAQKGFTSNRSGGPKPGRR